MFSRDLFAENTDTPLPAPPLLKKPLQNIREVFWASTVIKCCFPKLKKIHIFKLHSKYQGHCRLLEWNSGYLLSFFEAAGMIQSGLTAPLYIIGLLQFKKLHSFILFQCCWSTISSLGSNIFGGSSEIFICRAVCNWCRCNAVSCHFKHHTL